MYFYKNILYNMSNKNKKLENVIYYQYLNNSVYQDQIIYLKTHYIKLKIQKIILILHNHFQIHNY